MKLISLLLFLILLGVLAKTLWFSFRAQRPADYANTGPTFVLAEHLSGPIAAEGVIYGPTGRVTNTFVGEIEGNWTDSSGTLREVFTYANGNTQIRNWTFMLNPDGRSFTGTAPDLVGEATGEISGATIKMRYRIILPEEAGGHTLDVTDWLYRAENGNIVNRSQMRKYGITVAELVATLRPLNQVHSDQ